MLRKMTFILVSMVLVVCVDSSSASRADGTRISSSVDQSRLLKKKKTLLGLYVTAKETIAFLQSRRDVVLIDVRTPEETMFVGFPELAAVNIPYKLVDPSYGFNAKKRSYDLIVNTNFTADVRAFLKTSAGKNVTTLILMCRSGSRSAKAVDVLANAGVTQVYSMVDGFEGDKDKNGKRTVNGWINANAPWTTSVRENYWLRSR